MKSRSKGKSKKKRSNNQWVPAVFFNGSTSRRKIRAKSIRTPRRSRTRRGKPPSYNDPPSGSPSYNGPPNGPPSGSSSSYNRPPNNPPRERMVLRMRYDNTFEAVPEHLSAKQLYKDDLNHDKWTFERMENENVITPRYRGVIFQIEDWSDGNEKYKKYLNKWLIAKDRNNGGKVSLVSLDERIIIPSISFSKLRQISNRPRSRREMPMMSAVASIASEEPDIEGIAVDEIATEGIAVDEMATDITLDGRKRRRRRRSRRRRMF